MSDFNILELKNLLCEKYTIYYGYDCNPMDGIWNMMNHVIAISAKQVSCWNFANQVKDLKEKTIAELLKLDASYIGKRALSEYERLLLEFNSFTFKDKEYIKFNNFITIETFNFIDGSCLYWEEPSPSMIELDQALKIKNPDFLEWQKNNMSENTGINNPEALKTIDKTSREIKSSLNEIISFLKSNFVEDNKEIINSKDIERLSVKQQMLILHYLFAYLQSSTTEIPNNKLSQLLSKVLNRNSETIRGLLTLMSRIEENESDDKIAKTPKNLTAVSEIFSALNLQQLQLLVEKDLNKIKKDK